MPTAPLAKIVAALDATLRNGEFAADDAHNGLQVENSGAVRKVCCGVDASLDFFERARDAGANLCVVHHGLSWGASLARITQLNYRLLAFLLRHDMALYASHLPLDAHPELGNNAGLARALGLQRIQPFGSYHGMTLGVRGTLPRAVAPEDFGKALTDAAPEGRLVAMPFGKPRIRTVGVVSGAAADTLPQAVAAGLDAFVSGEGGLQVYNAARHAGIHAFFAGHYATETFGVRALAEFLRKRLGVPAEFVNLSVPY